jgi:hypothetical protein
VSWLHRILGLDTPADRLGAAELVLRGVGGGAVAWIVFGAIGLIALAVLLYRVQRDVPTTRKYVAAGLRAVFLVMVLALLLRPTLRFNLEGTMRRGLIVLVDDSSSMQIADARSGDADRKRADIALGVLDPLKGFDQASSAGSDKPASVARIELLKSVLKNQRLKLLDRLATEYELRPFTFAQSVTELARQRDRSATPQNAAWIDQLSGAGVSTALGDAIRDVLARTRGQPLAGIVLATDGASNSGNTSPLAAAESAREQGVPLYLYGVGIASPKDVIVANVFAQDVAFLEDAVPVAVRVRSGGMDGASGKVVLKLNDQAVAAQDVTFTGGEQLVSVNFTPKKPGEFRLSASIDPSPDEVVKDNNAQSQPIRVIDAKIKVLLVEQSPRWEFKYLQALLLRDRRVQLKCVLLEGDPSIAAGPDSPYLPRFPATKDELFKFDLVILGDVDPRNLAAGQIEAVNEFVSKLGGGFLMIAGRGHAPWAYRGTAIEKMLPVEVESQRAAGAKNEQNDKPIRLELTPAGKRSMMLRLADTESESAALWAKLAPVFWDAAVVRPTPAAEVLLVDPDPSRATRFGKLPVIAIQQYGVGQVCYVGTDNTWRWRRNIGDALHATLWGQIVQRLSLPHLLGESKRIQLTADKRNYATGERVTIFARLFAENYEPVVESSARGWYTLRSANGNATGAREAVTLRPVPDQPGMYRGEFTAPAPGEYQFALERDDKVRLDLSVADPKLELGETAMNEPLLRQLASTSGGAFFREEDLHKLPDAIRLKTERVRSNLDVEIWSSPAYFLLLLGLVTAEWILRKTMQLK